MQTHHLQLQYCFIFFPSTEADTNLSTANPKTRISHQADYRDKIPPVLPPRGQTSNSCHQVGSSEAQGHCTGREDLGSRTSREEGRQAWQLVAMVTRGRDPSQLL